jgi:hypothetical protein
MIQRHARDPGLVLLFYKKQAGPRLPACTEVMYMNKTPARSPSGSLKSTTRVGATFLSSPMTVKNSCNTNRTKLQSSQYSNSPFIRHSVQRHFPLMEYFSTLRFILPTRQS